MSGPSIQDFIFKIDAELSNVAPNERLIAFWNDQIDKLTSSTPGILYYPIHVPAIIYSIYFIFEAFKTTMNGCR
jgi:hypothetical protein